MADPGWGEEGVTTIRAGLGLGAVACVIAAIAPQWDLVEGPSRDAAGVTKILETPGGVGGLAVLIAIALVVAAFRPRQWLWLAGLGLATALAGACALVVYNGRTSSELAPDADVSLLTGGGLLTVAFWVAMVAVAVMLVGFRTLALAPRPVDEGAAAEEEDAEDDAPSGRVERTRASGKALLAFALSVAGIIVIVGSSLGVALGTLALGEIRASGEHGAGRGLAIAAIVVGLAALCLLAALVGVLTLTAKPSS